MKMMKDFARGELTVSFCACRVYTSNPYTRQLSVRWIVQIRSVQIKSIEKEREEQVKEAGLEVMIGFPGQGL